MFVFCVLFLGQQTELQCQSAASAAAGGGDAAKRKKWHRGRHSLFLPGVRAIITSHSASKSKCKTNTPTLLPSGSKILKYSHRFGASTFYEALAPDLSTTHESTSILRKMQNMKANHRVAANYCSMSLDRRIYRKKSVAARSGGKGSWQSSASAITRRNSQLRSWNGPSSSQLGQLADESWNHGEPLSIDDMTRSGMKNPTSDSELDYSNDLTSRLDDDVPSREQRFGDDVSALRLSGRRTGLSENANNSSAPVCTRSSLSDLDVDHVSDGPKSETATTARGQTDRRPQANITLKRHVGLPKTEAKDRRATWAMKRFQTTGSPSVRMSVTLGGAASDDENAHSRSMERSPGITEAVVDNDRKQGTVCYEIDSSAQTNVDGHNENSDDRLSDGEGTNFVSSIELNMEMFLELTENVTPLGGLQTPPSTSILSGPRGSTTTRQVASPRQRSDETKTTIDVNDEDDDGRTQTSPASQSPSISVSDVHPLSMPSTVYDLFCDAEKPDTALVSTTSSLTVDNSDVRCVDNSKRSDVSCVAADSRRRSSVDVAAVRCSVTPDASMVRCRSGSYRTSYGSVHDEYKSEPTLVCSPGNVNYLRGFFERAASLSVTESASPNSATAETVPVFYAAIADSSADERQRPDDAGQSTSLRGHSVRNSASSDQQTDSSASTPPVVRQHISPMFQEPPDRDDSLNARQSTSSRGGGVRSSASSDQQTLSSTSTSPVIRQHVSPMLREPPDRDDSLQARRSTSSRGHSVRRSTSSDQQTYSSTSTSPVVCQHISPMFQEPSDPVHDHDHVSDSSTPVDDAHLNVNFSSLPNDNREFRPEMSQLHLSSSLKDDSQRHRYCIFACATTCELYDVQTALPARRSMSDPERCHGARSHGDLLGGGRRHDVLSASVDHTETENDLGVGKTHNGQLVAGPGCVSVIAWHRPDHPRHTHRRTPASGPTLTDSTDNHTALLKHEMYRQVADMCGRLETIEIARHKPKLC